MHYLICSLQPHVLDILCAPPPEPGPNSTGKPTAKAQSWLQDVIGAQPWETGLGG